MYWNESSTSKEIVGLIGIIISAIFIFGETHGRLGVEFSLYLNLTDLNWE
jgi:hypothetical protein